MRIMSINNQQPSRSNQPKFGMALIKPFSSEVQSFIIKHVASERDDVLLINKAIVEATKEQLGHDLYDIQLVVEDTNLGKNICANVIKRDNKQLIKEIATSKEVEGEILPAIDATIKAASDFATLMKNMNEYS